MRKLFLLAICLSVGLLFTGVAYGFHDAGVAYCGGCHTMHNSQDGVPVDTLHPNGNQYLLKYATPSDVCLSCHGTSHGAVFGTDPLNPPVERGGGNFVFLLEDNINDGHSGATSPIPGYKAGHNLNAPSRGVGPDGTLSHAPGGTFPASSMECSSCHDPHGNTNFRLLYGIGTVQDGLYTFTNPAPDAVGISINGSAGETNSNHTAYLSGMSAWCGNCHGNFHNEAGGRLEHPSGSNLGGSIANNYNLYNGTANLTGGNAATAYLADVPFEDPANTITSTAGPTASSKVFCLTCHRAHASSSPDAGRWDFNVTFLSDDGVNSGSYAIPDPYNSPDVQRSLCNKCHVKDVGDEGSAP